MIEQDFYKILAKIDSYKFSSMKYIEYEEVENYEIKLENDNIILL